MTCRRASRVLNWRCWIRASAKPCLTLRTKRRPKFPAIARGQVPAIALFASIWSPHARDQVSIPSGAVGQDNGRVELIAASLPDTCSQRQGQYHYGCRSQQSDNGPPEPSEPLNSFVHS